MIEELDMPEHSKGLMNLDKLTLPKLIWLIKISWQEIPPIYLYFSVNDTLRMYKNDDIRMYNFDCITDTIVEVITTCNTYTLLTVHLL